MENELTLQRATPEAISERLLRLNPTDGKRLPKPALGESPILNLLARYAGLSRRYALFLVGAIWPLILLTPHVPGIPRPFVGGLPWRQELASSVLLTIALGLLIRRWPKNKDIRIDRPTLLVSATLSLFVIWIWLSTFWSATPYAAVHLGMQWTIYLVFFLVMWSVAKRPRLLHSSFVTLGGIVCLLAIACAIESWFGAPLTDGNLRNNLKPILRGSAGFGEIMAMAAILFASLALHLNRTTRCVSLRCNRDAGLVGDASVVGAIPVHRRPRWVCTSDCRNCNHKVPFPPITKALVPPGWRSRLRSFPANNAFVNEFGKWFHLDRSSPGPKSGGGR